MSVPPSTGDVAPPLANGRYRLVAVLGEGGQAVVFRAWDQRLRVWRAIKLLHRGASASLRARFEAEARTLARLRHPSLLVVHDVAEEDGRPYMVMHLAAESLQDRLSRQGPLPVPAAVSVVAQIADALAVAHEAGVVHRDVKPSNVLVDLDGTPLIADFGIARVADERRTRVQAKMGTYAYMAPEQHADASSVDARADVYSLGATLYAAITGCEPTGPLEDLSDTALSGIPAPLVAVLRRATARKPSVRHPSARALRADLLALLDPAAPRGWTAPDVEREPPPGATPTWAEPAPPPAPRGRIVLVLGVASLVAVAAGLVALGAVATAGGAVWLLQPPGERSGAANDAQLPTHRLTTHPLDEGVLLGGVSADGRDVVYTTDDPAGVSTVWQRRADGSAAAVPLPSGVDPSPLLRQAVGEHLELVGWTDDPAERPALLDRRTGRTAPLVQAVDDLVVASPDGRSIAWARVSGAVFRAPIDGGRPATVYQAPPGRTVRGLAWSPSGDALALVVVGPQIDPSVVLAAVDGTAAAQVYQNAALDDTVTGAVAIAWPRPDRLLVGEVQGERGQVRSLRLPRGPGAAERGPVLVQLEQDVAGLAVGGRTLAILGAEPRHDTWLATVGPDGLLTDLHEARPGDTDEVPSGWLGRALVLGSSALRAPRLVVQRPDGRLATLTECSRAILAGDEVAVLMAEGVLVRAPIHDGALVRPVACGVLGAIDPLACGADGTCVVARRDGDETVLLVFPPGQTQPAEFARLPAAERLNLAVSPDGAELVVLPQRIAAEEQRILVRPIGPGAWRERVVPDVLPQNVAWRTDAPGWWITGYTAGGWAVVAVGVDGAVQAVTPVSGWPFTPAASPDGTTLAFGVRQWDTDLWIAELPEP